MAIMLIAKSCGAKCPKARFAIPAWTVGLANAPTISLTHKCLKLHQSKVYCQYFNKLVGELAPLRGSRKSLSPPLTMVPVGGMGGTVSRVPGAGPF